jgi:hypothetical protein
VTAPDFDATTKSHAPASPATSPTAPGRAESKPID